jgi:hypothetical protein
LQGYFTPAPESVQQLVATVAPGGFVTPQILLPDGTLAAFPPIPAGEVFRVLAVSIQRQAVSASPALLNVSLSQQVPNGGGTANRWWLTGDISRNVEKTLGMDVGIAFANPIFINNDSISEDTVIVRLWGGIFPSEQQETIELATSLGSGQTRTPERWNPDGTNSTFSLPPGQAFLLNYISILRGSVTGGPLFFDVGLTQAPGGGGPMSRWSFRGTAEETIGRFFFPGIMFSSLFQVQNGPQSPDISVVMSGRLVSTAVPVIQLTAKAQQGQLATAQLVNPDGSISSLPPTVRAVFACDISIQPQSVTRNPELIDVSLRSSGGGSRNWWSFHGSTARNAESTLAGGVSFFAVGTPADLIQVMNGADSADSVIVQLWGLSE